MQRASSPFAKCNALSSRTRFLGEGSVVSSLAVFLALAPPSPNPRPDLPLRRRSAFPIALPATLHYHAASFAQYARSLTSRPIQAFSRRRPPNRLPPATR